MSDVIHLDGTDKVAKQLANATFPEYKGRKFAVHVVKADRTFRLHSMWDGGSRDFYAILELQTMTSINVSDCVGGFMRSDRTLNLRPGFVLVEYSIFLGRGSMRFYVLDENATKFLGAPVPTTDDEDVVLHYGRPTRGESGLTSARWFAAEATLITKGLLTKGGVKTTAGKNTPTGKSRANKA